MSRVVARDPVNVRLGRAHNNYYEPVFTYPIDPGECLSLSDGTRLYDVFSVDTNGGLAHVVQSFTGRICRPRCETSGTGSGVSVAEAACVM